MRNLITLLLSIIIVMSLKAQNYKLDFKATGIVTTLDSVHVLNMSQQTELMLNGEDTLNLLKISNSTDELYYESHNLSFYPNPLNQGEGVLSFDKKLSGNIDIEIYTLDGKLIYSVHKYLQAGHYKYRLKGMPSGLYMIKVETDMFSEVLKLLSINGKYGLPELKQIENINTRSSQTIIKSIIFPNNLIAMQYNDGEKLKLTAFVDSLNCFDTLMPTQSQTVIFHFDATSAPVADFTANQTTIALGDTVFFTDQSTQNPTSWSWTFGDGSGSTQQDPSHVYTSAGTYTVSLTASNSAGSDIETKTSYITVNVAPVADFTANQTTIALGDTVFFTDQSTQNPTSWSWTFGDGSGSTQQDPSHVYTSAGTYTVSLTASNSAGSDIETKTSYITVNVAPVADFTANQTTIALGDTVFFTDQSTQNPTSWSWTFGDGSGSTQQDPSHVYTSAGTYTVSLTASNSAGSDIETKQGYIYVTDSIPGNYPPGTVHCIPGGATVVDVTNSITNKTWMDRNLGASREAQSVTDSQAYGDLYQWGRFSDGHQCRNSSAITMEATTELPNAGNIWDGKFIESYNNFDINWLNNLNNNLWQGVSGTNNPCPSGYRLPTANEFNNERLSWSSNNSTGAYTSIKLPHAGSRSYSGNNSNTGIQGSYWSSTTDYIYGRYLVIYSTGAKLKSGYRGKGFSVRCIKD